MADELEGKNEDGTVGDAINVDETVTALADSLHLADAPVEGEGEAKPAEAAPPVEPPKEDKPAEPAAAVGEARVPDTWRPEVKAKWAALDPAVKAEINKREQDIAKYVSEAQPIVNVGQAFSKILGPFQPIFEQFKVNPYDHINGLLHAHYNLLFGKPEQKVAMLKQIMQETGIDPRTIVDPNFKPAEPDEAKQWFQSELAKRDAIIQELRGGVTGVTSALQQARAEELGAGILAFSEDTENHPFFWELVDDCRQLIDHRAARSLEEAYAMAELRNPTTRAKRLELDQAKKAAAQQAADTTKAASARKATAANVVSRGTGRQPAGEETIDQTLKAGLAKIHEREGK